jgi:hypothetical protein
VYEQTADLKSYMDGRTNGHTSTWTVTENVIGEFLQVQFENSPPKGNGCALFIKRYRNKKNILVISKEKER